MTRARGLVAAFATLYFVQGVCEPVYGLLAQPVRAQLLRTGSTPGETARAMALLGLPWLLKPLFGPLIDRGHQRAWMSLASALACAGFVTLALSSDVARWSWLALLLLPSFAIALGDVATDALMVQHGQRLAITGVLQSAQWSASYLGTLAIGWWGGALAGDARWAFTLAAVLSALGFASSLTVAPTQAAARVRFSLRAALTPRVRWAALFLFLLGFNPFHALDYVHITRDLGLSDGHYGQTVSVGAAFSLTTCLLYGWLSKRVELARLGHAALGCSLIATLSVLLVDGAWSNFAVNGLTSMAWTFTLLMQLDLAARLCPPEYAGTVFALLMGVSNGADTLAAYLGGTLHDWLAPSWGAQHAYALLVVIGAACTALAWLPMRAAER
ncbi:MAG TPA: MFS transporter [Polyangiales bacterium]|nr:MFS transporter [Polyangiales bacterium]